MVIQIQCKENHDMENNNFEPQNEQQQYGQAGQAPQQPYSAPQQPYAAPMPPQDKANVGLAILSYLIPLVGIIIYFTQKNSKPKNAITCGKCALASIIINVVLSVIIYAVAGAALFSATDDTAYTVADDYESYELEEDETQAGTTAQSGAATDEVDPELKAFLDDYENFIDEYIAFMEKYSESDYSAEMISDYSDMMTRYYDFAETYQEYDPSTMSPADAGYYTEVSLRVSEKLENADF